MEKDHFRFFSQEELEKGVCNYSWSSSDYAHLSGKCVSATGNSFIKYDTDLINPLCFEKIKTSDYNKQEITVLYKNKKGNLSNSEVKYYSTGRSENQIFGIRPVLVLGKETSFYGSEIVKSTPKAYIVKYGEYPSEKMGNIIQNKLDFAFLCGMINETGKIYVDFATKFKSPEMETKLLKEYELDGEKYIRYERGTKAPFWYKVLPIEWIFDKETGVVFTKDILLEGIRLSNSQDWSETSNNLLQFLNEDFVKEIGAYKKIKPMTRVR